jgi:hypothetical protein
LIPPLSDLIEGLTPIPEGQGADCWLTKKYSPVHRQSSGKLPLETVAFPNPN